MKKSKIKRLNTSIDKLSKKSKNDKYKPVLAQYKKPRKYKGSNDSLSIINERKFLEKLLEIKYDKGCGLIFKDKKICPSGPWNNTELLSNENIDNVLKKIEILCPFFKPINFTMDDWQNNKETEVYKLAKNITYICELFRNNKKCIGFIMNTDDWDGPGIHWTAMFIDLRKEKDWYIEFFNSSSNKPSKNIENLIKNIVNNLCLCNAKPYDCTTHYINIVQKEHQKSETECGVYCLAYILCRCKGLTSNYFNHTMYGRWLDETMVYFREWFFSPY